jgi:MoaA/NifB/PqqE/SkfB family radical SAM enzyme
MLYYSTGVNLGQIGQILRSKFLKTKYNMQCKFITNGISISYNQVIKPCNQWKVTTDWQSEHHLSTTSLVNWHSNSVLAQQKKLLEQDTWPEFCESCKNIEEQGRHGSVRSGGNNAYQSYSESDIILEIRPGSVCNFACQTCWPEASSRVAQYYQQANLIEIKDLNSKSITNFDFLLPIAHRIKDVVLLGGEPFYDKNCKKFLTWAANYLKANITMFTNGSYVDFDFLESYAEKITLVFSIDAIGKPAEYVRFGTDWEQVLANYNKAKTIDNIDVRVNITCSVYNYAHLGELIEFLCKDWPSVVSFCIPKTSYFLESVIPIRLRAEIINQLRHAIKVIWNSNIPKDQQYHASNAIASILKNLKTKNWDQNEYQNLCGFIKKMDLVKNINATAYSEFLQKLLVFQD